jgi:uncharacterized membrane protein
MDTITILAQTAFVLIVPGMALSYVMYKRKAIDMVERLAIAFALSVSVIPLMTFCLSVYGLTVSRRLVVLEVVSVLVVAVVGIVIRSRRKDRVYHASHH